MCIIGGGPAGIATALSLRILGIEATVIESSRSAEPKIGESLPPGAEPVMEALHIVHLLQNQSHLTSYGNSWLWGSEKVQDRHFLQDTGGNGWHLRREVFESEMREEAIRKGVRLRSGYRLESARQMEDGSWKLDLKLTDGTSETWHTNLLVDASGRHSKVGRINKVRRHQYDHLTAVAAHFKHVNAPVSGQTHIESTPQGWWYAAELSDGEIVTVFLTDETLLEEEMKSQDGYLESLSRTRLIRTLFPKGAVPDTVSEIEIKQAGTSRLATLYGTNWVAVGDAAQSYDPVSSYGITSSLKSGYYAGRAIAAYLTGDTGAFQVYRDMMESIFSEYLELWKQQYQLEQRWTDYPFWSPRSL